MSTWWEAGAWGLLGGAALVLGAVVAWFVRVPQRVSASIMAFGAGVLISALAFDLTLEAQETGGTVATVTGVLAGAVAYAGANAVVSRYGGRHRKRSGGQQPAEQDDAGSGAAIAIGSLLDGIPESVVLGVSLVTGGGVSTTLIAAIFISNVPEGLSSVVGMKRAGRSARYVFGVWGVIAVVCAASAAVGFLLAGVASPLAVAVITAVAAGAILAMIADTMIPEAFERAHLATGLITAVGFLVAFALSQAGG
jgi:ZIP family zinc transporter